MSETRALIGALKRRLRAQRVTYREVAAHLGLSEASVKRMFSRADFRLDRLEAICSLIDCTLPELVQEMEAARHRVARLSEEQEQELVADPRLMLVAYCVLNHWSVDEILEHYALERHELTRLLVRLDRLQLIELLPGDRVRLRVTPDFRWIPGGPVERNLRRRVHEEFMAGDFSGPLAERRFLIGHLSPAAIERLRQGVEALADEFQAHLQTDARLPAAARAHVGLSMMIRPCELSLFSDLRRPRQRRMGPRPD